MSERDLILTIIDNTTSLPLGTIAWEAPANIAIIKYWGKYPYQIPANPSLSFALRNCVTRTEVAFTERKKNSKRPVVKYAFNKKPEKNFADRIDQYLHNLSEEIPWINELNLDIKSSNTFPASAGIASSASSFASLALSLSSYEYILMEKEPDIHMMKRASHLARLGSGSAARSVFGGWTSWGETPALPKSNNSSAVPLLDIHPVFKDIHDAILVVSSKKKEVSSSEGHALMQTNPFRDTRIEQANQNHKKLLQVLSSGDQMKFIEIAESEALTLHAMMMTSLPWFILLKPNSLHIMNAIRDFRKQTGIPVGFTVDAGPNIHVLYFDADKIKVEAFIKDELVSYCEEGEWIADGIGDGPLRLNQSFR